MASGQEVKEKVPVHCFWPRGRRVATTLVVRFATRLGIVLLDLSKVVYIFDFYQIFNFLIEKYSICKYFFIKVAYSFCVFSTWRDC